MPAKANRSSAVKILICRAQRHCEVTVRDSKGQSTGPRGWSGRLITHTIIASRDGGTLTSVRRRRARNKMSPGAFFGPDLWSWIPASSANETGVEVHLSPKEFDLLAISSATRRRCDALYGSSRCCGPESEVSSNTSCRMSRCPKED